MARVHFFQRYSSKENAVTNNTLLLLSQIYGTSPDLLENFISELNEDLNFRVGPEFGQQIKGVSSVPDGIVSQTNFKKRSKGGMRGTQYFDLGELLETDTLPSISEIAKKLSNIEW
jgi:hypothetical protein